jgi:hypothetical protein
MQSSIPFWSVQHPSMQVTAMNQHQEKQQSIAIFNLQQ